jgi:NADP-dependent aldehyde dehydrogenase
MRGPDTAAFIEKLAGAVRQAAGGTMLTTDILGAFERSRDALRSIDGVSEIAAAPATAASAATQAWPSLASTDAKHFLVHPELASEAFGPFTLVITVDDIDEMVACANALEGQLTATLHATDADIASAGNLIEAAEHFAGRLIINGFPTGVEVSPAMNHGGPYPATTDARFTSVGTAAMLRFARPICYQDFADAMLPVELHNANPTGILRTVNGVLTRDAV